MELSEEGKNTGQLFGGRVTYVMWCDCLLFGQLKCLFLSFSVGLARQANRLTD